MLRTDDCFPSLPFMPHVDFDFGNGGDVVDEGTYHDIKVVWLQV